MVPLDVVTTFFGRISSAAAAYVIYAAIQGVSLTIAESLLVLGCVSTTSAAACGAATTSTRRAALNSLTLSIDNHELQDRHRR